MIGISSTEFSAYPLEDVLPQLAKLFQHWEIFSEAEHNIVTIAPRLAMIKDSYNLTYSIHAPICDINIASLNDRIRESSVVELIANMEQANELNIKSMTIHPGLFSMAVPYMEEKSMASAKKSLRTLDRISDEYGVMLAVEIMPAFKFMLGQTAEEMQYLLDGTNLGVCFDIGHANTTGQIDEILSATRGRIVNFHVHDNDGTADQHLTIGDGNIDFKKYIPELKNGYRGKFIIESKSLESGVDSRDRLTELLSL